MHSLHNRRQSGFTLIELLTVIAIIGILAAIILPVTGRVRDSAKSARCTSNLRQMGPAFMAFAVDHKERYPLSWAKGNGDYDNNWYYNLSPYLGMKVTADWNGVRTACDPKGVLRCPSNLSSDSSLWISYKMSNKHRTYLTSTLKQDPTVIKPVGLPLTYIRTPAQSLLVADGRDERTAGNGNPDFGYADASQGDAVGYPHRAKLNALFADGHVKTFSKKELEDRWATIYSQSVGN